MDRIHGRQALAWNATAAPTARPGNDFAQADAHDCLQTGDIHLGNVREDLEKPEDSS
jgi:hypothetical protein